MNKKLQVIKDAYWSTLEEGDTYPIHDAISNIFDIDADVNQVHAIFNLFDGFIIGQSISWGMDDTEVRDNIHEFIEDKKYLIAKELNFNQI